MKNTPRSSQMKQMQLCARIAFICMPSLLFACTDAPPPRKPAASNNLAAQSLMQPDKAAVSVTAASKRFDSFKGDIPVVTIAYSGADSAEVWRCRASYSLVYGNGLQKLSELSKSSPEYRSSAKDAYERMRGDRASCSTITKTTTAPTLTDYAATDGKFYYIVNPCVSQAASATGEVGCSYNLELTQVIDYKNTRTDYEVEVLAKFTDAEGRLYGNFNSMRRAAEEANASMTSCVLEEAGKRAAQAQLFGVIKLVSALVVAPVVNGLMVGVGTVLNGAINQLLGMAAPQQIQQIECPNARTKMMFYNDLQGQTVQLAQEVLEARQKLAELDGAYKAVEKELATLKSNKK